MKQQPDHRILSSLALFIDNRILTSGQAFYNHTGSLTKTHNQYEGRHTYSLPFKQIVNDTSVPNANQFTGVYLNGNPIGVGQSGLLNINHYRGTVDFSSALPANTSATGAFAVKEINIYTTTDNDEKIIFENKYYKNPKYQQNITGLEPNAYPVPALFIKKRGGENQPFSLGSASESVLDFRVIIISDEAFLTDGVCSILKDTYFRRFALVSPTFDARGAYTGVPYNYTGLATQEAIARGPLIKSVRESTLNLQNDYDTKNDLDITFLDFEVSHVRGH